MFNSVKKIDKFIIKNNIIPKHICHSVTETISKSSDWAFHKWHNANTDSFSSFSEKELKVLDVDEELEGLLNPYIISALSLYHKSTKPDYTLCSQYSKIRFNRYEKGTLMREHFDHIYTLFEGNNKGIPVLSIVGTLNQSFTGGKFMFFGNHEIKMKTGDILIFPSNFMYPHKVTEILSGERYSFVSWAW